FAFLSISLALLGFGASGTFLSVVRAPLRRPHRALPALGWGFALATLGAYFLVQALPFDAFRVALNPEQWGILALHCLALSLPFFCVGATVGLLLALRPGGVGRTYAANLAGSATGCILVLLLLPAVGAEGVVLFCAALGGLAGLLFGPSRPLLPVLQGLPVALLVAGAFGPPAWMEIRLSPYKGLSYALQYPDSRLIFRAWNSVSRVDVVEASAIRSLPGQGIACRGQPPPQRGLFVDGDDLSPIPHVTAPADLRSLTDCTLHALPYRLRPGARALVLEPRGGWDLWVALAEGARSVTAVEPNSLIVRAVREQAGWTQVPYDHPQVDLFAEDGRAFVARPGPSYDVVLLSLTASYHPVTSGAYSLAEDYRYTVEGLVAAMKRLAEDGLLALVRWAQSPPSEELRAFALAIEAVERTGGDPAQSLVALRSYNQVLILARRGPFPPAELRAIREFAAARSLDLVYAPDVRPEEVNRYNVMPTPEHYLAFTGLLNAPDRSRWLADYPFDVSPPTDDRPFFGHFFRWGQLPQVVAMAGHVWQPFGGAGYLVLLGLLGIAVVLASLLILLPLAFIRVPSRRLGRLPPFGFLGLAFMLVEVPLLQRFILFLGHPTYAMSGVLGVLLLFSGVGSALSARVPFRRAMGFLLGVLALYSAGLPLLSGPALGQPFPVRIALTVLGLAPLGFLMGIPFPRLVGALQEREQDLVPWAWGVNGALSVVASVGAAMLALSWGFRITLVAGALMYLCAWLTTPLALRRS
ncbi:MAG: hypothetical protein D6793_04115, partial [Thermoflexia bacterium]